MQISTASLLSVVANLIFAFCFCGVWCFKEAALAAKPDNTKPFIVGLVFILIAFLLAVVSR